MTSKIVELSFGETETGDPNQTAEERLAADRATWKEQTVNPLIKMDERQYYSADPEYGDVLLCPVCGNNYLHQGRVEVFSPDTENSPGTSVEIGRDVTVKRVSAEDAPNYRDCLSIGFACENGCRPAKLFIRNRKGFTYMRWVADPIE